MGVRLHGRRLLCTKGMERRFKLLVTSCVFLWEWVPRKEDIALSEKKKKEEEKKSGFSELPPAGATFCFGGKSSRANPPVKPVPQGRRRKKPKGGPGTRLGVKEKSSF